MGSGPRKKAKEQTPRGDPQPAEAPPPEAPPTATPSVTIYQATLVSGPSGAVAKFGPPITKEQAVLLRRQGVDVVVCGPNKRDNSDMARDIEQEANTRWMRSKPHVNAGPQALPHYQPDPRPPAGHTFYETDRKKAR